MLRFDLDILFFGTAITALSKTYAKPLRVGIDILSCLRGQLVLYHFYNFDLSLARVEKGLLPESAVFWLFSLTNVEPGPIFTSLRSRLGLLG